MEINKIIILSIFAVLACFLSVSGEDAQAITSIDLKDQASCEAAPLSGTWILLNTTCRINGLTLNSGDSLLVDNSTNPNIVLTNIGTLANNGNITINLGSSIINFRNFTNSANITNISEGNINSKFNGGITNYGGTITNSGFITNIYGGSIGNFAAIRNNFDGIIYNLGVIRNYSTGIITNSGNITNSGGISNLGGTITNHNTITNNFGGSISNYGGTVNNTKTIINNSGTISNFATFTNSGNITDSLTKIGYVSLLSNMGNFTNIGTILNNSGGQIGNVGTITNTGIITNMDFITNNSGGIIENFGTLDNVGIINNTGIINNRCGAIFSGNTPTGNPVNNIPCQPSTSNGKIAFSSNRTGHYEIYTMNTDGTSQQRITNHAAQDWFPQWSPDGHKITFDSDAASIGDRDIYTMNSNGTGIFRIPSVSDDDAPDWSPDGTKIVYSSNQAGDYEIFVVNANGTGNTRLTFSPGLDEIARWSPDGKHIVFGSHRGGNWEIYSMNANGTGQTRLTNNTADDYVPDWSPDGKHIVFQSNRDGNRQIYLMNFDGTGQTRLSNDAADDREPSWSPDGTKIVFDSNKTGNFEIYSMNANGTGQTRLTNNTADDILPSWGTEPNINDTIPTTTHLTVIKKIINDNGGNLTLSGVKLKLDGNNVTNGTVNLVIAGNHTISETAIPGYTATFGGDCNSSGKIAVAPGDNKACTITNNDNPRASHSSETYNQFDPITKNVLVFGRDPVTGKSTGPVSPISVIPFKGHSELRTYHISDISGNSITVVEQFKKLNHHIDVHVLSVQYNNGTVIKFGDNKKQFNWKLTKDGTIKQLNQEMEIGHHGSNQDVKVHFDSKTNISKVIVKSPKTKTNFTGMILLRMATNNGNLIIEFP